MMRIDGDSLSTDHPAQEPQLCAWCKKPQESHEHLSHSLRAFFAGKAAELWNESSQESAQEIPSAAPKEDSNSLTARGDRDSRSWLGTGSSGSVCRRLRRGRSVAIWEAVKSQRGTATGSRSDSLKSLNEAANITGMVPAVDDCPYGWTGMHLWSLRKPHSCLNCGRANGNQ